MGKRMAWMLSALVACVVATAGLGVAQAGAAGQLTMDEARGATIQKSMEIPRMLIPWSGGTDKCTRLSPNRIRCDAYVKFETNWKLKWCDLRVEVTKDGLVKARVLRQKCHELDVPFLSIGRGKRVARKVMDPHAFSRFSDGSSTARPSLTRMEIEASWTSGTRKCIQEARIAIVDGKVRSNVGEPVCVDEADWPTAGGKS